MSADESERRLAEALRAQARGGGRPVLAPRSDEPDPRPPASRGPRPSVSRSSVSPPSVPLLIVLWLLAGAVLGCGLALLSLLVPGSLPAFG